MSKHTPGPWTAEHDSGCRFVVRSGADPDPDADDDVAGRYVVWGCGCCGSPLLEGVDPDADARLIAAAPELLAALIAVVAVGDRKSDAFDLARAAIAKATGEASE